MSFLFFCSQLERRLKEYTSAGNAFEAENTARMLKEAQDGIEQDNIKLTNYLEFVTYRSCIFSFLFVGLLIRFSSLFQVIILCDDSRPERAARDVARTRP